MTTVTKQLAHALSEVLQYGLNPGLNPGQYQQARLALDAYKESEEFKRDRIDEGIRSASTTANKLDDDMRELLANVSLLTDAEEILLRNARELIAEAADHLNKIIDPEA